MMAEKHDDAADGELVATVSPDPLRMAFGSAIEALMNMLGDCPAREVAVKEIMAAEERTRERLINPPPPSCSTGKSWLHFRPPPVDFCSSRLAIGAATERARALAMPAGTRAQALQTRL